MRHLILSAFLCLSMSHVAIASHHHSETRDDHADARYEEASKKSADQRYRNRRNFIVAAVVTGAAVFTYRHYNEFTQVDDWADVPSEAVRWIKADAVGFYQGGHDGVRRVYSLGGNAVASLWAAAKQAGSAMAEIPGGILFGLRGGF